MKETRHTGGLMEFHCPKDYKHKRTESDKMRSRAIREYYEKEAIIKAKEQKNKEVIIAIVFVVVVLLFLLRIL